MYYLLHSAINLFLLATTYNGESTTATTSAAAASTSTLTIYY